MSARRPIDLPPDAAPQHADHAGLADAAMHLDAPLGELGRDDLGRAVLLQPDLRVGMQVAADGGQLIVEAADRLDGRHGLSHRAFTLATRTTSAHLASSAS